MECPEIATFTKTIGSSFAWYTLKGNQLKLQERCWHIYLTTASSTRDKPQSVEVLLTRVDLGKIATYIEDSIITLRKKNLPFAEKQIESGHMLSEITETHQFHALFWFCLLVYLFVLVFSYLESGIFFFKKVP